MVYDKNIFELDIDVGKFRLAWATSSKPWPIRPIYIFLSIRFCH